MIKHYVEEKLGIVDPSTEENFSHLADIEVTS
jgi:hypothetical protein